MVGFTPRLLRVRRPIGNLADYAAQATLLGLGADLAGLRACEDAGPAAFVAAAGVLIFRVECFLARRNPGLAARPRLILALVMGGVTAPWLTLLHRPLLL